MTSRSRPQAADAARSIDDDRFRRLHAVQRDIVGELDVTVMVQRIVDAAREVLDVSMAALAVLDPDDAIERFIHSGVDDDTASHLRSVAAGARFNAAIQAWCATTEFRSVQIEAGGKPFADLYVAGPLHRSFDESDVELLEALARSAGSAIAHARLFARATRSTSWLHASGEIARALLAEADVDMFGEIVDRAVGAAGADYGQLMVPCANGRLKVIATSGTGAAMMLGQTYDYEISDVGRAVANGKTLRAPDVTPLLSENFENVYEWGPVMIVPLLDAIGTRGSVIVSRRRGRAAFSDDELTLFATFASQVALAMQFADSRADSERMQVLETRHNTARELHDIVIQRLFATGVGLQALSAQVTDPTQSEQIVRYVRDLDDTIDEIRDRVFGLQGDAISAEPRETIFPRIALDAGATGSGARKRAGRPAGQRGRRRSDWTDGTGERRG